MAAPAGLVRRHTQFQRQPQRNSTKTPRDNDCDGRRALASHPHRRTRRRRGHFRFPAKRCSRVVVLFHAKQRSIDHRDIETSGRCIKEPSVVIPQPDNSFIETPSRTEHQHRVPSLVFNWSPSVASTSDLLNSRAIPADSFWNRESLVAEACDKRESKICRLIRCS